MDTTRVDEYLRTTYAVFNVQDALGHLRKARNLLVASNAPRAAAKVRRALKSAEGALRNAECRRTRVR